MDYFVPIPLSSVQAISPSYKVNIRGVKLDSKDTLGKSGIISTIVRKITVY